MLEIQNPGYVTYWAERAYKQAGSSVAAMKAGEHTALALHLPGDDYSSLPWQGEVNSALVLDFARKVIENGSHDFSPRLVAVEFLANFADNALRRENGCWYSVW